MRVVFGVVGGRVCGGGAHGHGRSGVVLISSVVMITSVGVGEVKRLSFQDTSYLI